MSELASLVLNAFYLPKILQIQNIFVILPLFLFLLLQITTIIFQSLNVTLVHADLIVLGYPIIASVSYLVGTQFGGPRKVLDTLFYLLFAGAVLAIFQEHFGSTGMTLSKIYNTPALTNVGRFGGFSYTHTEHAAFCALALTIFPQYSWKNKYARLFMIIILLYSAIIPLSKAGFILLALVLLTVIPLNTLIISIPLLLILIFINLNYLRTEYWYIFNGFQALYNLNFMDGALFSRYEDWQITTASLTSSARELLLGGGPRRVLEQSYIEITLANILYRWGLLGTFLYYFPIIISAYVLKNRYQKLSLFLIFLVVVDTMANFTESLKLFPIVYFLIGFCNNSVWQNHD